MAKIKAGAHGVDGGKTPANSLTSIKQSLGNGGELHQVVGENTSELTTNQGVPVSDNQNSLKANERGPALLEDFILREKIHHFDHERIPERIVHARGTAAHGFFELTSSLEKYTTAKILTEVGEMTPLFTRIAKINLIGMHGSPLDAQATGQIAAEACCDYLNQDKPCDR